MNHFETPSLVSYDLLRSFFDEKIIDHNRFEMVYAFKTDAVVVGSGKNISAFNQSARQFLIGFDIRTKELVILPFLSDLTSFGKPVYLREDEISSAKYDLSKRTVTIKSSKLKHPLIFTFGADRYSSVQLSRFFGQKSLSVYQEDHLQNFETFFDSYSNKNKERSS